MQVSRVTPSRPVGWPDVAVAVGNFDGVHRGHQELVRAMVSEARAMSGTSVVLTFDPHPGRVLFPRTAPRTLLKLEQRAEILATLGVDQLAVLEFDRALARLSPEAFATSVLRDTLAARAVVVGESFRFGRRRAGDVATLAGLGRELGFRVRALAPLLADGRPISSSRIREALAAGEVREAGELLGREFFVEGSVVRGAGRGRTIGVPTANLAAESDLLPAPGVYAGRFRDLGEEPARRHACVVNVGRRPTFDDGELTVEAHLLGFDGDLYDHRARLFFIARLRDERRFDGVEALLVQIRQDMVRARALLQAP